MKTLALLFFGGWMLLIIWFSAQPAAESKGLSGMVVQALADMLTTLLPVAQSAKEQQLLIQHLHGFVRKVAHGVNYFVLGCLAYQALRLHLGIQKKAWLVAVTMLFCAAFAAVDELHQVYVPGRSGELRDVMIDSGSALAGILFCSRYGSRKGQS
ncbi:VanZ family protein [Sporomusa termitida]|uniref:VanZ like family protein n=1 Tax=Sporomusa termitida TaxID=2377 RepID=A0A517DXB0_9FIRM|nr:VanZ family protein [Sporomusa termitida]QDR81988.1 VanZ like family protein [Sporomusa termitida]